MYMQMVCNQQVVQ